MTLLDGSDRDLLNARRSSAFRESDPGLLGMVANVLFLDEVSGTATNPT